MSEHVDPRVIRWVAGLGFIAVGVWVLLGNDGSGGQTPFAALRERRLQRARGEPHRLRLVPVRGQVHDDAVEPLADDPRRTNSPTVSGSPSTSAAAIRSRIAGGSALQSMPRARR